MMVFYWLPTFSFDWESSNSLSQSDVLFCIVFVLKSYLGQLRCYDYVACTFILSSTTEVVVWILKINLLSSVQHWICDLKTPWLLGRAGCTKHLLSSNVVRRMAVIWLESIYPNWLFLQMGCARKLISQIWAFRISVLPQTLLWKYLRNNYFQLSKRKKMRCLK